MLLLEFLKRRKLLPLLYVVEGFVVLQIAHWAGGEYVVPALLKTFPRMPVITAATIGTSNISVPLAILYMAARLGSMPVMLLGPHPFSGLISGLVLAWLVTFVGLATFDRTNPYAMEILQLPDLFKYHGIFSLVIWQPIVEELLARGLFFGALAGRVGILCSTMISTGLFVLTHGIWSEFGVGLILLTLYSLAFNFVYVQAGLIGAAATHMLVNGFLLYLNKGA